MWYKHLETKRLEEGLISFGSWTHSKCEVNLRVTDRPDLTGPSPHSNVGPLCITFHEVLFNIPLSLPIATGDGSLKARDIISHSWTCAINWSSHYKYSEWPHLYDCNSARTVQKIISRHHISDKVQGGGWEIRGLECSLCSGHLNHTHWNWGIQEGRNFVMN
jgi:hypothetical protein